MINLGFEPTVDQRTVYVQDEPALEIALPELCPQPELTVMQRGKIANVEALVSQVLRHHQEHPDGALGPVYQELVTEFQPLFAWTIACWDYLLSSEGCRFVPRQGEQRFGVRGDYRAVTDKDYSRMVHGLFRASVLEFAQQPDASSLNHWLRQHLWPSILESYRRLENPPDPRQRVLTPYSYLRCMPYQFLNEYHHDLVYSTVQRLPEMEQKALSAYFFHFYTEAASAAMLEYPIEELLGHLRAALVKLLVNDRLVYCLLRQIERY